MKLRSCYPKLHGESHLPSFFFFFILFFFFSFSRERFYFSSSKKTCVKVCDVYLRKKLKIIYISEYCSSFNFHKQLDTRVSVSIYFTFNVFLSFSRKDHKKIFAELLLFFENFYIDLCFAILRYLIWNVENYKVVQNIHIFTLIIFLNFFMVYRKNFVHIDSCFASSRHLIYTINFISSYSYKF